jgi:hypothetical protein
MNIKIWYCPKCDKATQNWKKCNSCGGAAVYREFILVPREPKNRQTKESK